MPQNSIEVRLKQARLAAGTTFVDIHGADGRTLRLSAADALEAFLRALVNEDPGLPPAMADWLGTHAYPGQADVTALVVDHYRRRRANQEPT